MAAEKERSTKVKSCRMKCLRSPALWLILLLTTAQSLNAAPPVQTPTATLRVINESQQTICYIQISPNTDTSWGPDRLTSHEVILPNQIYVFELEVGEYDIRLMDCEQNILVEAYSLAIATQYDLHFGQSDLCATLYQAGTSFYGQAYYNEALEQFQAALVCSRESSHQAMEGTILTSIGLVYHAQGRYAEALVSFQQALAIRRESGDRVGEATTLNNIGEVYRAQGRYARALENYRQASNIRREMGDHAGEGIILNNMGAAFRAQGRYVEALNHYQEALAIAQSIPDRTREGIVLSNIGEVYHNQGRYAEALKSYQEALSIHREVGNRAGEGITLNNIGGVYDNQGYYIEALESYQQALSIHREIGNRAGEGATLNNIGDVYDRQGLYTKALENYRQALSVRREVGDRAGEATTLNNIAGVHDIQGRHVEALENYQQALTIMRELGNRPGEGTVLNNIGLMHHNQGRYTQALENYRQAIGIHREVGNRLGEGQTLGNIGEVYEKQGRYAEALAQYRQALILMREIGDRTGEAEALKGIGLVYRKQGRYAEALETYRQALSIHRVVGNRAEEGSTLNNIGVVYYNQGRYAEALRSCQEALDISREVGNQPGEGQTLSNIGLVYHIQGRYAAALESYRQALIIRREVGDRSGEGITLNNIGGLYDNQGRYTEALDSYQQALAIARDVGNRFEEAIILNNIGLVYKALGQYDEALFWYQQALDVSEVIRTTAGSEQGRASFIAQHAGLYARTLTLFQEQGQSQAAFIVSERSRARAFLDSLATGHVELSDNEAAQLLNQEQEVYAQRQAIQDKLAKAYALDPPDPDLVADLEAQLAKAEVAYEEVLKAIEARGGQLAAQVPGPGRNVLGVPETQARLDEGTTLISYSVLEDQTLAFLITRNSFQAIALSVGREELASQIRALRDFPNLDVAYPDSAITLYGWLIEPLKEHLNTPHLAVIPHSVLHYLPFAALTDGARYLVDDYVLTTLPSASALPFIQENTGRELSNPLILGNPTIGEFDATASFATERDGLDSLPFAEQEAKVIAALYGVEPLLGKEATEGKVREGSGEAGILHLAAHGFYSPIAPLSSLIALAPDEANDGWLTVGEVYGLDLSQADLVVLSACQTNLGELSAGDELVGLTRAFIFAGTPTVVASLWSVEDESTALLMERFYTHLREGMAKAEALRQAQLEVREQYPNPYYWAGFVLSGDGGEIGDISLITIEEAGRAEEAEATSTLVSPAASETTPPSEARTKEKQTRGGCLSMMLPLALMGLVLWRQRAASV
jgi:tetratricopeptide (TPR) repeat protein